MTDTRCSGETSELLPCPFCGNAPKVVIIEPHSHAGGIADFMPDHHGSAYIDCGCGVGIIDANEGVVIARWNRRTGASAQAVPDRETLSAAIYEKMPYEARGPKPPWIPRGNSFKQDEARQYADVAIAALYATASPAVGGWQPIETAPRDGNPIIAWDDPVMGEAYFDIGEKSWWWTNTGPGDYTARAIYPTLWRPMPAVPSAPSSTHRGGE